MAMMYCLSLDINTPHPPSNRVVKSVKDRPRRFECPICHKVFKRREHQDRHVSTQHKGEKPHLCSAVGCNKRYTRREELLKHFRLHHETKPDDASKDSELVKNPDRDRVHHTRPLLPRVERTNTGPIHTAPSKFGESIPGMALKTFSHTQGAQSTYTHSLDTLATAAFQSGYSRDCGNTMSPGRPQNPATSIPFSSTTGVPVSLPLSPSSSVQLTRASIMHHSGHDVQSPQAESMKLDACILTDVQSPTRVHNPSASSSWRGDGRNSFPSFEGGSITRESFEWAEKLAHKHGQMATIGEYNSSIACVQSSPTSRSLPISSLLCSADSSIEDIFRGCSRKLPPPRPP